MRSATRSTTSPVARDVASVGGLALVTFLVVARQRAARRPVVRPVTRDAVRARAGRSRASSRCARDRGDRRRSGRNRPPAGPLRVALVQGNDKNRRAHRRRKKPTRYLPRSHFELAEQIKDPVDLIVFPESSMDEDPRVDPVLSASALAARASAHDAWVLANAVADAPDGRAINLNVLLRPGRRGRGHVREAPSRAVRRTRAVASLPRGHDQRDRTASRATSRRATTPGIFDDRRVSRSRR